MRNALNKLWTSFFVAVLLVVPAAVVSGLAAMANPGCFTCGGQAGLTFWFMGIAAHQPVLSDTDQTFRHRLAIWLTAMTVGAISAGLGAIVVSPLMQITADHALTASGHTTSVFWLVVAIRTAIRWAPVAMAWVVSRVLVGRSSRRERSISPLGSSGRGRKFAVLGFAVVAAAAFAAFLVSYPGRTTVEPRGSTEQAFGETLNPYVEIIRLREGGQVRVAPVAVLSIDALLAEYRENEFAAAAKYESALECLGGTGVDGCRVVETSGTIRDMGRGDNGVAYIRLATADEFVSIEARFGKAEQEALWTLRRGQRVSVRCMVLHDTRGSAGLLLTRCGIV